MENEKINSTISEQVIEHSMDRIAYWVDTARWPKEFRQEGLKMSRPDLKKRKYQSTHSSNYTERLLVHGNLMKSSTYLDRSSKTLCFNLLKGEHTPQQYPCYPPEQIQNVLERIHALNEARLQRDIMPWIVPSAENLYFSGQIELDYIGEEIQVEWSRCTTLGGTKPKPNYTAGLMSKAFTQDEIDKLQHYASPDTPFFFTPNLCFPFLMCEAQTGQNEIDKADLQNIHSGSIAVNAIITLYKTAFGKTDPSRVKELDGQILAFSVSHNNRQVNLYGHYAILDDTSVKKIKFCRYEIAIFSLTAQDGANKFKPYNFVLNVYNTFAPAHKKRIQDAVAFLP